MEASKGISTNQNINLESIIEDTRAVVTELLEVSDLEAGDILVVGCSSSEVDHHQIGSFSNKEIGQAIFDTINKIT